jgi:hypothetical protein
MSLNKHFVYYKYSFSSYLLIIVDATALSNKIFLLIKLTINFKSLKFKNLSPSIKKTIGIQSEHYYLTDSYIPSQSNIYMCVF